MAVLTLPATSQRTVRGLPSRSAAPPHLLDLPIASSALLNGQREILIRHGDSIYRLRHTSNDKLILTK